MDGVLKFWTDGSCEPNPGPGGWGYTTSDGREAFGGARETTNNRMELTAILEAMRTLKNGEQAVIYSDSQYAVNGLTVWHDAWKRRGWKRKGAEIPNRDLWLALEAEIQRVGVMFRWVKGHDGNPGNERADELAGIARIRVAEATEEMHPVDEFEMPREMFA